jgi:hypothetical protein
MATAMPIRFTNRMTTVRMVWIRTRRRPGLSDTLPSINDPYSGAVASRPLCRVMASRTRPNRCATLGLELMVASA